MPKPALTDRQVQVVRLVSLGCSIEEISKILGLAFPTVNNHRARAMKSFGTDKAVLMTRMAIKYKIIDINDKLTPEEKFKSGRNGDGWN